MSTPRKPLSNHVSWSRLASELDIHVRTVGMTRGITDASDEYDLAKNLTALCRISVSVSRIASLILFSGKRTAATPSDVLCCDEPTKIPPFVFRPTHLPQRTAAGFSRPAS